MNSSDYNYFFAVLYIISYLLLLGIYNYYEKFSYSVLFLGLWIAIYPTLFLYGFTEPIYKKQALKLFYKHNKTSKEEIENLIENKTRLNYEREAIEKKILYERESNLIKKIENFLASITLKTLDFDKAKSIKDELKKENDIVKSKGYQHHRQIFYDNRFNKIEDILSTFQKTSQPTEIGSAKTYNTNPSELNSDKVEKLHEANNENKLTQRLNFTETKALYSKNLFQKNSQNFPESENENITKHDNDGVVYKPDYIKINELRNNIGNLGEMFVFEWEKSRLIGNGYSALVNSVKHCSKENDALGYDILSFDDENTKRYIEVKTTTDNYKNPFFLTEFELMALKKYDNYFIYRVFDFDVSLGKGKIYIIHCKSEIEEHFNIQPVSYKVFPK